MTTENKILHDLENSPKFPNSDTYFHSKKSLYESQVQGAKKEMQSQKSLTIFFSSSYFLPLLSLILTQICIVILYDIHTQLPEFSLCPSALPWDLTNTLENAMPSH
jgi:hypothetical protein